MSTASPPKIPFDTPTEILEDGLEIFKNLLRINTTNPPANEYLVVNYAEKLFEEVGLKSVRFEASPGRESIMTTYGPDNENRAIFSAHVDVVPAYPEHWEHPPFEAVEADGCIWGRGAIDMKNMAAFSIAVIRYFARHNIELKRSLRVILFADEEAGCREGSLAIARSEPEWLKGYVAVTEVGGFTTWVDNHKIYPIQVAEKGFIWLKLHIEGTPGHGSMPSNAGAIDELAAIVQHLSKQPFDFRYTQPARDFLEGIAGVLGFPKGNVFKAIGNKKWSDFILDKLVRDPGRTRVFRALLRDTVAPTVTESGDEPNVIPSKATLTLDCRILPGTDPDAFIEGFKSRVPGNYEIEVIDKGPPVVMDKNHPIMDVFTDILEHADPGAKAVPQMITGFTDSRAFDEVNTPCYGFSPIWLPPEIPFAPMFHGHNERLPIHGFRWGQACMLELARRLCVEGKPVQFVRSE